MTVSAETHPAVEIATTVNAPQFSTHQIKIALALLAVYTIWGSTYLGLRVAVETMPPFFMTGTRYIIAGTTMYAFLRLRGAAVPTRLQLRNAIIIGSLMLGVGTGGVAFAEQWVASGLAALAVGAVPLWAALFAGLWGHWPSRLEWGGLGIGLFGLLLLNLENGMQANPLGALALIVGPMCWAFASMLSRRLDLPRGLMATAVEMVGGGVFMLFVSTLAREHMTQLPSLRSTLALMYLVTFGTWIAFNAYMYLLREVRPVLATSYAYVNPIVAVFLGVLLANEHMTLFGGAAMVVILSGVGLLAFARQQKQAA